MTNIVNALTAPRVLVSIVGVLVLVLVGTVPQLAAVATEIMVLVTSIVLVSIGGLTWEEAARQARETPLPTEWETAIISVLLEFFDSLDNANAQATWPILRRLAADRSGHAMAYTAQQRRNSVRADLTEMGFNP